MRFKNWKSYLGEHISHYGFPTTWSPRRGLVILFLLMTFSHCCMEYISSEWIILETLRVHDMKSKVEVLMEDTMGNLPLESKVQISKVHSKSDNQWVGPEGSWTNHPERLPCCVIVCGDILPSVSSGNLRKKLFSLLFFFFLITKRVEDFHPITTSHCQPAVSVGKW